MTGTSFGKCSESQATAECRNRFCHQNATIQGLMSSEANEQQGMVILSPGTRTLIFSLPILSEFEHHLPMETLSPFLPKVIPYYFRFM